MKRTHKQQTFQAGDDIQEVIDFMFEQVDAKQREYFTEEGEAEVAVELDAKYIIQITKIEP